MDAADSRLLGAKRKSRLHFLDLSFSLITARFEPQSYYNNRDYILGILSVPLAQMSFEELRWCFCRLTSPALASCINARRPRSPEGLRADLPIQKPWPGPYLYITTAQPLTGPPDQCSSQSCLGSPTSCHAG